MRRVSIWNRSGSWTRSGPFLNHGSFGARLGASPPSKSVGVDGSSVSRFGFMLDEYLPELEKVRRRVAQLAGAPADEVVLVPNATYGVSSVLRSLKLSEGDELIVLDQAYGACPLRSIMSRSERAPAWSWSRCRYRCVG